MILIQYVDFFYRQNSQKNKAIKQQPYQQKQKISSWYNNPLQLHCISYIYLRIKSYHDDSPKLNIEPFHLENLNQFQIILRIFNKQFVPLGFQIILIKNIFKEKIDLMTNPQQIPAPALVKPEENQGPCSLHLIGPDQDHPNQDSSHLKKDKRPTGVPVVNNFIQKTFAILQQKLFQSIVSWASSSDIPTTSRQVIVQEFSMSSARRNGCTAVCSFKIHNIKAFQEIVLPKYFKHSNMSSFVRQLNMYNFHKVRGDKNEYEFEHQKFVKNRPDLLHQIKRKQVQSTVSIPSISLISNVDQPANYQTERDPQPCEKNQSAASFNFANNKPSHPEQLFEFPETNKNSAERPPSNEQEQLLQKLAELQQTNRHLKKAKQSKLNTIKQISSNNKAIIVSKFNKIIMSIISSKLEQDITSRNAAQNSTYNLGSLHAIVQHIIDYTPVKAFKQYISLTYPFFQTTEVEKHENRKQQN